MGTSQSVHYGRRPRVRPAGAPDEAFAYTFTYRMRPTPVRVQVRRDAASGTTWLFVTRA